MRLWLAAGIVGASVASAGVASAQDRPLAEAITVAQGDCLRHAALLEHLRAWLERDQVDARLSVVVQEEEGGGASFAVITGGAPRAARRFERLPRDCADRRAAVALAIALAIDAAVLDGLVAPALREPREAPPPAEEALASTGLRVSVEVVAQAVVLVEVLPEVAAAWQVGARLVFDRTVELGFSGWLTSVAGAELQPGRVDTQLSGGRLDACLRRHDDVVVRGCVGLAAGGARGRGLDVPDATETRVPYVGLAGGIGLAFPIAEVVAIEVGVDGWLALVRPRFDLVDGDRVVTSTTLPLGGGMGALGASVEF